MNVRYNDNIHLNQRTRRTVIPTYTLFDKPLVVSGVAFFERDKRLVRLSDEVIDQLPHLDHLDVVAPVHALPSKLIQRTLP